jgi:PAS domain S-box-containing protein
LAENVSSAGEDLQLRVEALEQENQRLRLALGRVQDGRCEAAASRAATTQVSEHKRTEEELRRSQMRLEAVKEIGALATSSPELEVVLSRILQGTTKAAGGSVGMLFLKDPVSGLLRWAASLGLSDAFVADYRERRITIGEGLTGTIAASGMPIYIAEDSSNDPRIARPVVVREALNSFIGVPIRAADEIIGVMNILTRKPDVLGEQEISLVVAIGAHVGSAILNAQLYKQLQEAEATLAAEQNLMAALIDALDDTFFVFETKTGKARRWNRVFREKSGYTDQEIAEQKAPNAYYDEEELKTARNTAERLLSGGPTSIELTFITKDQQRIPFEYSAALLKSPLDDTTYIVSVGRDLTHRKKMEHELLKVQKLESLGILAGGIAHDFNNLLTAIIGNISLCRLHVHKEENDPTGDARAAPLLSRFLADAERASFRAQDLTRQLLTFSKGGAPIKRTVALPLLIRETCGFVLHGASTACQVLLPDQLWEAEVDEGQISQVIQNVLLNATQAMPEGGMITLSAENLSLGPDSGLPLKEGRYVRLSVADRGYGIPPQYLSKIFDPYFTTKQEGSGLGLATSFSIIKNHGGHITVESELAHGTTFHIYLPASQRTRPQSNKVQVPPSLRFQKKVLVMDDEDYVRDFLAALLRQVGCTVLLAEDGREAIRQYRQAQSSGEPVDVVLMDLTVPGGMGGKEAIAKLLEIDPNVTAVVSSGYSNDPVMASFREVGFVGCLSKPFTAQKLLDTLQQVLGDRGSM